MCLPRIGSGKAPWLWLSTSAVVGLAAYVVLLHQVYTWRGDTHPDFFIEWMGSRVALQGGNPYSEETTLAIQMGSKGYPVPPGEDQLAFVYPFYRVFLNLPIAFLPYDWATALWQGAMQAALLAGSLLFARALDWQASLEGMALVVLAATLSYPAFGGLMLGQMATGVLALFLIAFWALRRSRDALAGVCLALATVKPQLAILAVPALLLWCLSQRRWRTVLGFAAALGILAAASWAVLPAWLGEFARAAMRYPSYKSVQTGPGYLLSPLGGLWPWVLEVAAAGWLLVAWWAALRVRDRGWGWQLEGAFCLTMAMTCFLLPQTSIVNHVMLLPAVVLLLRDAGSRWARIALAVTTVGGSWLAFASLYNAHYAVNMALPPLVVLSLLGVWYVERRRKDEQGPTREAEKA